MHLLPHHNRATKLPKHSAPILLLLLWKELRENRFSIKQVVATVLDTEIKGTPTSWQCATYKNWPEQAGQPLS